MTRPIRQPRAPAARPMAHRVARPAPGVDETLADSGRGGRHVGSRDARRPTGSAPTVAVASDVGRVRTNNEDYAVAERVAGPDGAYALWIVADGVGGGPHGERASRLAVETLVEYLASARWTDPAVALTEGFALANARVHALSAEAETIGPSVMATTLVAALFRERGGAAWVANVGDSRAYVLGAHGLQRITEDHTFVAEQLAAGRLTEAEASLAGGHNVLTRGIGTEPTVTVDVFGPRRLHAGDRLLLCSDGLHGMVSDGELQALLRRTATRDAPSALVAAANEAGGRDNITAIVGGPVGRVSPALIVGPAITDWLRKPWLAVGGLVAALIVAFAGLQALQGGPQPTPRATAPAGGASPTPTSAAQSLRLPTASPTVVPTATPSPATPEAPAPATPERTTAPSPLPTLKPPVNVKAVSGGTNGRARLTRRTAGNQHRQLPDEAHLLLGQQPVDERSGALGRKRAQIIPYAKVG